MLTIMLRLLPMSSSSSLQWHMLLLVVWMRLLVSVFVLECMPYRGRVEAWMTMNMEIPFAPQQIDRKRQEQQPSPPLAKQPQHRPKKKDLNRNNRFLHLSWQDHDINQQSAKRSRSRGRVVGNTMPPPPSLITTRTATTTPMVAAIRPSNLSLPSSSSSSSCFPSISAISLAAVNGVLGTKNHLQDSPSSTNKNHLQYKGNYHYHDYYHHHHKLILQSHFAQRQRRRFRVYCDLDGVLVDFCRGIRQLYHDEDDERDRVAPLSSSSFCVDALHRPSMWQRVEKAIPAFFEHLPWMETGPRLWNVVKELEPTILTGVPAHPHASRYEKVKWCQRELGIPLIAHTDMAGRSFQHVPVSSSLFYDAGGVGIMADETSTVSSSSLLSSPSLSSSLEVVHNKDNNSKMICHVITCWSHNKHYESGPGAVLIDDRHDLKAAWEAKGGIFVHHTGCAEETIAQLQRHGILQQERVLEP